MNFLIFLFFISCWLIISYNNSFAVKIIDIESLEQLTLTNTREEKLEALTNSCSNPGSHFTLNFFYDGSFDNVYISFYIYGTNPEHLHIYGGNTRCGQIYNQITEMIYSVECLFPMTEVKENSLAEVQLIHPSSLMKICLIYTYKSKPVESATPPESIG